MPTKPPATFLKRFTYDFLIALAILAITGLLPALYFANQAQKDVSEAFISQSSERAVNEFRLVGNSTESAVRIVRQWGESGLLSLDEPESINQLIFPLLKEDTHHLGISVADTEGRFYHIREDQDGIRTTHTRVKNDERIETEKLWNQGEVISEANQPSDFDPRSRPWFFPAMNEQDVYWTQPYVFYAEKIVGVTASTVVTSNSDGYQMIVAFDLSLEEVYSSIRGMQPSPNSEIAIVRRDASLYTTNVNEGSAFKAINDTGNALVQKAHAAWRHDDLAERIVAVQHDGEIWWCGFQPLNEERQNTWVGVMVPKTDTIIGASKRHRTLVFFGIFSILIAAVISYLLANRQTRGQRPSPQAPFDPEAAIAKIHDMLGRGESKRREFKSTMRTNLHTNKPGKEIELAWIKGVAAFLNTDGGTLLIGVSDDGEILGMGPDKFESDDHAQLHFKNLIAAHIGAEFSKYIDFRTVTIDEKLVGLAECQPSNEPVFVKHPKGENFFIRNGPSSDELPVSQALEYIKNRKESSAR